MVAGVADRDNSTRWATLAAIMPNRATRLDLAVEFTGYLYILSYNSGTDRYRLDIYDPGQTGTAPLATTQNINAAKLTVDFWRNVYTLNYERGFAFAQRGDTSDHRTFRQPLDSFGALTAPGGLARTRPGPGVIGQPAAAPVGRQIPVRRWGAARSRPSAVSANTFPIDGTQFFRNTSANRFRHLLQYIESI